MISFEAYPEAIVDIFNQALRWGILVAHDKPILADFDAPPTYAQALFTQEIFKKILKEQHVTDSLQSYFSELLRFLVWEAEMWVESNLDTFTVDEALQQFSETYGIIITSQSLYVMKKFARDFSPGSEIYLVRLLRDNKTTSASYKTFVDLLNETLTEASVSECLDYGQHNVSIVVSGQLFDFAPTHPIVSSLFVNARNLLP